jgi:flagellar hook-basal body complex protein FliE
MDVLDRQNDEELLRSLIAEVAKANNELNCATNDIKKARSRLNFLIVIANKLIERQGD